MNRVRYQTLAWGVLVISQRAAQTAGWRYGSGAGFRTDRSGNNGAVDCGNQLGRQVATPSACLRRSLKFALFSPVRSWHRPPRFDIQPSASRTMTLSSMRLRPMTRTARRLSLRPRVSRPTIVTWYPNSLILVCCKTGPGDQRSLQSSARPTARQETQAGIWRRYGPAGR